MIFLDLVKIYNVFYIMTMETLDRYKKLTPAEMNKALILYKNFCNFTDTLKKEANTIPMLFGFTFKEPNYYKPDPNKERAMKNALKDRETGGDDYMNDEEGFAEEVPEFEDQEVRRDFEDEKDDEGEDSDDDYQFDLLSEAKKIEQMASVSGVKKRNTMMPPKKEKIKVDDFNTAALDDLLGGGAAPPKQPQRSGTMGAINNDEGDEWDPFGNKGENVYSTQQPSKMPETQPKAAGGASGNIFGDDDNDMWGDNQATASNQHQTRKDQKQTLDDILGGGDDAGDSNQTGYAPHRSQSMAAPKNDFDMLKNLYNTSTAQPSQQMNMGGQPDYFNTGAPASYGGGMGAFNTGYGAGQGYGGQGYGGTPGYNQTMGYGQQPQTFNTSYGGGYSASYGGGYGGAYGGGYGGGAPDFSGFSTGYNPNANTGFGYNNMQPSGFNTAAPSGQSTKNNNDFDPFA